MKSPQVQAFYSRKAQFYQRFFVDFLKWENVLTTFFKANNYLGSNRKILDAGCGSGSVTKVLFHLAQEQGVSHIVFHGFDLTPAMLDLFRQWIQDKGASNIQVQQADVLKLKNQLPLDWTDYDLVVSSTMLEYIPVERHPQALANLKAVLRENGRLLLLLTKRTWITRWIGQKWWGTHLFDPDALATELHHAGFSQVHFKMLPRGWDSFLLAVEVQVGNRENDG